MKKLIALFVASVTLTACGSLSMTRETTVMKKQGDFSPSIGGSYFQSPYHGDGVRESKKGGSVFGLFRYGVTDDFELQAGGALLLFVGTSYELRAKYKWLKQDKYEVASSVYYI